MDDQLKAIQEIVGCGDELAAELGEIIQANSPDDALLQIFRRVGAGPSMKTALSAVLIPDKPTPEPDVPESTVPTKPIPTSTPEADVPESTVETPPAPEGEEKSEGES